MTKLNFLKGVRLGLAFLVLILTIFTVAVPTGFQVALAETSFDQVSLFSNSNLTLTVTPAQYSAAEGRWNYRVNWSRRKGLLGSIYINGNRFVDSATGVGENYTGFSLVPGETYNVVFYSLRNGKGVKVANRKFTVQEAEDYYNVNDFGYNQVTFQSTSLPNAIRNMSYVGDAVFNSNVPITDGNVSVSGLPSGLYAVNALNLQPMTYAPGYSTNYRQSYQYAAQIRGSATISGTFYPTVTVWANGRTYSQRYTLIVTDGSGYGYGYGGGIRFTGVDTFEPYVGSYFDITIPFVYTSNGYTNYSLIANFDKLPLGLGVEGVNGNQGKNGIICTSGQTCSIRVAGYPTQNGRVQTTLYISDQNGVSASRTIIFNIGGNGSGYSGNLNVNPTTLPSGNIGQYYQTTVRVNYPGSNYSTNMYWSGLPNGITGQTLNYAQNGYCNCYPQNDFTLELKGYPTVSGYFNPVLTVEYGGQRYSQTLSLYISPSGGGTGYSGLSALLTESGNISASVNSRVLALPFRLTNNGSYRQVKNFEFEVRRTDGSSYLGSNNPTFDLYWTGSNQLANLTTSFQNGLVTTGFNSEIYMGNPGTADFQFYVNFDQYASRGEYRISLKRVFDQYGSEIPLNGYDSVTRIVNLY